MNDSIAVIGSGVIGGAIVRSLLKSSHDYTITASDIALEKINELKEFGVSVTSDNKKAAKESEIIFVCVKPNYLKNVLEEISQEIKGKLVISSAAAVTIDFCKRIVPNAKFVRIMPNVAITVQESFTAYCCSQDITPQEKEIVKALLNMMGIQMEIEEKFMDAITAVSGSGPGYISIIIEALTYAGLKVGLPRKLASNSAAQAVLGTAKLILETGQTAAQIRDNVTTPGGTTIEAIYEVERSQIRQALMRAVESATKKSNEIRKKWNEK
ncbi:MAG: pyrroline-5-carboxylate reductase [Candidatus Bathyarchaeota archaeon]